MKHVSKHTQCIVANTADLNMQKKILSMSGITPRCLGRVTLKKENKQETAFINSCYKLHGSIKLSNIVPKCRCFGVSGSIQEMCFHGWSFEPKCSSVVDNSSSPPCGVSDTVHASAHLGKVHVWSPGVWTVEAQVSGSDGLARGFDARERREDLLWFQRFSC